MGVKEPVIDVLMTADGPFHLALFLFVVLVNALETVVVGGGALVTLAVEHVVLKPAYVLEVLCDEFAFLAFGDVFFHLAAVV